MNIDHCRRAPRRQAGFSMIEVLMVIVLFSFGLLGLVGLQARAMQFSGGAEDTGRAAMLANELASEMWSRNTVELPAATVTAWATRVADGRSRGLPNGVGTVAVTGNIAEVTVRWRAPHEPSTARHQYVTQVLVVP